MCAKNGQVLVSTVYGRLPGTFPGACADCALIHPVLVTSQAEFSQLRALRYGRHDVSGWQLLGSSYIDLPRGSYVTISLNGRKK